MGYGIVPSQISASVDPFEAASGFTLTSNEFITAQIEAVNGVATNTLSQALGAIQNLSDIGDAIALPEFNVSPAIINNDPGIEVTIGDIPQEFWGHVTPFDPTNTIDTSGLPSISTVIIPGFEPTPFTITIPPPPIPSNVPLPGDSPVTPALTFPDAIVITLPDQPQLEPIVIPAFTSPSIADFNPTFPTFTTRDISTLIDWQEPVYTEQVIDAVKTQLAVFFTGGSGIDPEVEASIFARGRDREDRVVIQLEQQATEEWATKGYTAPPGMLVKRIDNIREEGMLKKLGLNREQTIKVFDTEIENLRFAVQQGLAAEELYIRMFLAKVERLFEVQKLSVEWQIQLYTIAVQVFGIQMEEVKVRAQVYEVQVRAAMIEIEIFKALIEGEKVKADINKVLIEAYVAEISAREAMVRMYGEQVKAVGIEADVFKTQVEAYKSEVDAYAARIGADKNRFDAYASQLRGEATKVDILDAEARVYATRIQGIETGVKAEVAALQGEVSAVDIQIRNYEATIRGLLGRAQAELGEIQANVAGNNANTQRFIAQMAAEETHDKVQLAAWEGTNRVNLEIFRADIASFQAQLERAVKEIELLMKAQESAGGLASTITAGALAAMHVGASLSSSSGVNASGSQTYSASAQESVSCSTSNSSSLSFESTGPISHDCPSFLGGTTSSTGGYLGG